MEYVYRTAPHDTLHTLHLDDISPDHTGETDVCIHTLYVL